MISEKQIIEGCKNDEREAKQLLYEQYSPVLYGICLRYTKNETIAEDLLHEGFIKIYDKIGQFKYKGSFEGWLKRLMVNTALMYIRAKSKTSFEKEFEEINENQILDLDEKPEIDEGNVKSVVTNTEFSDDEIQKAVSELPNGYRLVFNMYAIEGLKHKEIANKLNISINTSKTQLIRARKQLQTKLYDLAIEKEKKKRNKEKIIIASIIPIMSKKLSYIDKIAKSNLSNRKVSPSLNWDKFSETLLSKSSIINTNIQVGSNFVQKFVSILGSKVTIITGIIVTSSIGTFVVLNQTENSNEQHKEQTKEIIIDTTTTDQIIEEEFKEFPIVEKEIQKDGPKIEKAEKTEEKVVIYDTVKVPVKKKLVVKRKKYIKDTIKVKK